MLSTQLIRNTAKSAARKAALASSASSSRILNADAELSSRGGRLRYYHSDRGDELAILDRLDIHAIAEPMPALALAPDYDDECFWEDEGGNSSFDRCYSTEKNFTHHCISPKTTNPRTHLDKYMKMSIHGKYGEGGRTTMCTTSNRQISSRKASGGPPISGGGGGSGKGGGSGSGGGGAGKHKCPKCGTSVTFKHADFEDNTFYCATCSGWFLVKNANITGGEDGAANVASASAASGGKSPSGGLGTSVYGVFNNDKLGDEKKSPKILMQHVSHFDTYTTRRYGLFELTFVMQHY